MKLYVVLIGLVNMFPGLLVASASAGTCEYTSQDEFNNSICVEEYKVPDGAWDTTLTLTLGVSPNKTESAVLRNCQVLSANHGEYSYVCPVESGGLFIANYERGYYSHSRIWVEPIKKETLGTFHASDDHEHYRASLKTGNGKFELKPDGYVDNRKILSLIKP